MWEPDQWCQAGPRLSRDVQSWGGLWRRREAGARRRGSALRAGAGRGRGHPPQDPPPSANTRCSFSSDAAESGRWGGGGRPRGDPAPSPGSAAPRTHVSSRPARNPAAAQRFPAPRGASAVRSPRQHCAVTGGSPLPQPGASRGSGSCIPTQRAGRGAGRPTPPLRTRVSGDTAAGQAQGP